MPQAYTVYTVASSAAGLVFCMLLLILYWKERRDTRKRKRRGNDEIPFSSLECAKHRPRLKLE